jgi:hypothetical protein
VAAWCPREGINDELGGTHQPGFHRGGSLDGYEGLPALRVKAATKLPEGLGEHKVRWRARGLVRLETTRVHHRQVGPQAVADILISSAQCMFEQLQSHPYPEGKRGSSSGGAWRKACGKTVLDGGDQRGPREGIGPLAQGMRVRHTVRNWQTRARATQPMLKRANKAHRAISSGQGNESRSIRRDAQLHKS